MADFVIFALLFVAIGIGWLLGRRSAGEAVQQADYPASNYPALNDVLKGRPDGAIDAFINSLEVSVETVETHLVLGTQLRQKGEVERAVRVHQNLLAGPGLPPGQVDQARLELARDYISAGLLDRAEQLLLTLVQDSPEQRCAGQRHLLELYEIERDWPRAVEVAQQLLPRKSLLGAAGPSRAPPGQSVVVALAHYYCELAAQHCAARDYQQARQLLNKALQQDKRCTRASIMLGEVEIHSGRYREAVQALHRVRQQDSDYVPETIALLRSCYRELGDESAIGPYLQECLASKPTPFLVVAIAEDIQHAQGSDAANEFLAAQLAAQPSLRGLSQLIGLQVDASHGQPRQTLELLQGLVHRLVASRPAYRCGHCGFSGRHLHWNCPGCKYWGSIKITAGAGA